MRGLKGLRWLYWGERFEKRLGWEAHAQRVLTAPILRATAVVGIGRRAELDFAARFPLAPHFSIPYCCDLSAFFKLRRSSPCGPHLTFLFCGQMIHRKGIDLLFKAFDQLVSCGSRAQLLLLGREAELGSFISAVSPDARRKIRYLGFQPPDQLARFFGEADVFVLPSRYDGWGVVINQALAAGMPIICSDQVGAGAELVMNGVNGFVVPAGDPIRLREAMEWFVKNPVAIQPFGSSSRSKARKLTPQRGAQEWLHVFERLNQMEPHAAE
ncbi:glycosyltransferase family 4 protein [Bradyrhizobium centrosematis]|uniref:glycosyltransferase family 4 protein n=1 Tax=Bradyrhizobium centrosematis TaxID=1300039 RepID=UPI00388E554B